MGLMRALLLISVLALALPLHLPRVAGAQPAVSSPVHDRSYWVALAKTGFTPPDGQDVFPLLLAMNPLLGSSDPVLRDEVAYSAAERWILRDRRVAPAQLRELMKQWSANLDNGLGDAGDDRVFGRSFSALCLSVIAASDLEAPFLAPAEARAFFDRLLDYFHRENDVRGFDPARGWMHSVAHTSDALKFLARNPKLAAGTDSRLLSAVRAKIESTSTVFTWGENDRMALALQSAVRRDDADGAALEAWVTHWTNAHRALWANGPQVNAVQFARVENAKQVMRSLHAALSMEASPTPNGTAAEKILLTGLAKMR
jgi:Protein of unknown function (DUF2785)